MKIPFLPLLCALVPWSVATISAVDFTLRHGNTSADGATLDGTYVTDGESKIYIRFPHAWTAADSANALLLTPNAAGCQVRIENVPGSKDLPLDEAGKIVLRKKLDAAVPGGAKNVTALPEQDNPLPIFAWKDVEMGRTYEFFGQTVCQDMYFFNMRPGRVVQVTITAPKAEYENVHEAVRRMMFTWFEPAIDLPPEVARKIQNGTLGGS